MKDVILAIAGKPGLYRLVSRGRNMLIVESIDAAKKRMPAGDRDRVYPTDMKKLAQWYNILVNNGYTSFVEEETEAEAEAAAEGEGNADAAENAAE